MDRLEEVGTEHLPGPQIHSTLVLFGGTVVPRRRALRTAARGFNDCHVMLREQSRVRVEQSCLATSAA